MNELNSLNLNKIKKISKRTALLLSMIVILLVAAISAMFSSSDAVTNRFRGGRFDIKLREDNWTNTHNTVTPNEEMKKDPKIENVGETDAYVFLEVQVPYYSHIHYETDNNGNLSWGDSVPSVKFLNSEEKYSTSADFKQYVNNNWLLISESNDTASEIYTYIYAYVTNATNLYGAISDGSTPELKVLTCDDSSSDVTPELFNQIKLFNAREISELPLDDEEDITGKTISVNVYAHGIQVQNLVESGVTSTDPWTVWSMLSS